MIRQDGKIINANTAFTSYFERQGFTNYQEGHLAVFDVVQNWEGEGYSDLHHKVRVRVRVRVKGIAICITRQQKTEDSERQLGD